MLLSSPAPRVFVSEELFSFDLQAALLTIPEQRRRRALSFRHELGQRQSVLAYMMLCRALREVFAIDDKPLFEYGEHGKPTLKDMPGIFFSLSHCRKAVACAVATAPVGIDIETIRPVRDGLVEYAMNSRERLEIAAAPDPATAFCRLWTRKEATFKLLGTGITSALRGIIDTGKYAYSTVESNGYVYSTAQYLPKTERPQQ